MKSGQPVPAAELDALLDGLTRLGGVVSAAEAVVATPDGVIYRRTSGFRVGGEPLRAGCRFDAASLTKPWMATLALALDAGGLLPLSTKLGDVFEPPALSREARTREVTLEDLLRHRSGVSAWAPLKLKLGGRVGDRAVLETALFTESLWIGRSEGSVEQVPPVYSDLGYILWGLAAERARGRKLGELLDEHVCGPLQVAPLGALAGSPPDPVECRLDNGKEVELAAEQGIRLAPQRSFHLGVPQDGNARALGFLTGHAGLFVTAGEMVALGRAWLRPAVRLLAPGARERALAGAGSHALGWARWSADGSSGPALSPSSFGHSGFTGGSLWIDPERERIYVLLAHRLASKLDFNPFRREFHRLAAALPKEAP